jgi:putative restriction endonuclease
VERLPRPRPSPGRRRHRRRPARRRPASPAADAGTPHDRYGAGQLIRPRLGQAAFRRAAPDAYARSYAATGEHSLPVLDAAHIQPWADGGAHETTNGLLLRADWTMYSCTASTTPAT